MHLRSLAVLLIGIAAFLSPTGPAASAVRLCKAQIAGQPREATSELQAKKLALESWIAEARKLGANYVSWQLAINKRLTCQPSALKTFRCQAIGQPCTISQVPPPKGPPMKPKGKGIDI